MQIDLAYCFVHNGIYFLQLGAAATQGDGGSATLALYSNSQEVFVHLDLAYGFGYNGIYFYNLEPEPPTTTAAQQHWPCILIPRKCLCI